MPVDKTHMSEVVNPCVDAITVYKQREEKDKDSRLNTEAIKNCYGIAILNIEKGGFIVGGINGDGLVISRLHKGTDRERWSAPYAVRIAGRTIGLQGGLAEVHTIIVLKTQEALDSWIHSEYKVGLDMDIALFGSGHDSETNGDGADYISWSEGIYAGLNIDGAHYNYYRSVNEGCYGKAFTPSAILVEGAGIEKADRQYKHLYEAIDSL